VRIPDLERRTELTFLAHMSNRGALVNAAPGELLPVTCRQAGRSSDQALRFSAQNKARPFNADGGFSTAPLTSIKRGIDFIIIDILLLAVS